MVPLLLRLGSLGLERRPWVGMFSSEEVVERGGERLSDFGKWGAVEAGSPRDGVGAEVGSKEVEYNVMVCKKSSMCLFSCQRNAITSVSPVAETTY